LAVNPSKITKFFQIFKGRPLVNTAIALLQVGVILFVGYQLYKSKEKAAVEGIQAPSALRGRKSIGRNTAPF